MLKKILKFKLVSVLFSASFILIAGGMLWTYRALHGTSGPLILHFNNIHGITQIRGYGELMEFGATGLVVVFINFIVALELEARDRFLSKFVAAATLLFGILLFLGFA